MSHAGGTGERLKAEKGPYPFFSGGPQKKGYGPFSGRGGAVTLES